MSEPIDHEALADLARWFERYAPYRRRLPLLAPVFEALDRLGVGRVLLRPNQYAIYGLVDPDSGQIVYIGMTSHPEERLLKHREADPSNPAKTAWMEQVLRRRMYPAMRVLEIAEGKEQALQREACLIEAFLRSGHPLLNAQSARVDRRRA